MKIIKILHLQKTDKEDYTEITFKSFWGKLFTKTCITPNWNLNTFYADSGTTIPTSLWGIVKGFLRTGDTIHKY